jgi:anti-sigma B factor antagonist
MKLHIEVLLDRTVLRPTGRFDAHESPFFQKVFDSALADGATNVDVELTEVNFIDSTALAELVRAHRLLETIGGTLTLRSPSDPVRVILEITRLASFFTLALLPV